MRHIKLPQLLIEVDNELQFTRHFLPPAQSQSRPVDEICAIIAAVMALGFHVGPDTMAQLTPGITYRQIKRITDWQLTEETQRSALALVVNAIANLDTTKTWGEGKTSASDGQRFAFSSQVLQQTYSHKFRDFALEFYSFVADNYAPFYSVVSTVAQICRQTWTTFVLTAPFTNSPVISITPSDLCTETPVK